MENSDYFLIKLISNYCLNQFDPQVTKDGMIIIREIAKCTPMESQFEAASFKVWLLEADLDTNLRTLVLNNLY